MYALKMGHAESRSAEDNLLTAMVWLWTWTTECTINLGLLIRPDQAQPCGHSIYKNTGLRARYERALASVAQSEAVR